MPIETARKIVISTLHELIALHETEEKRLRRLIVETESSEERLEAILDLERVLRQIRAKWVEVARLEKCEV